MLRAVDIPTRERTMRRLAIFALILGVGAPALLADKPAQSAVIALAGKVGSETEPAMEGVLVRAKGVGSPMSVTVVTNRYGEYSFPADRLPPRTYSLDIRAVGYDLVAPVSVEVTSGKTARADLQDRKSVV